MPIVCTQIPTMQRAAPTGWCAPTVIYVVLSVLSVMLLLSYYKTVLDTRVLIPCALYVLMALVLYWLCANGYRSWAWFVLLLPMVVSLLMYVLRLS